jgi:putative transposase
MSRLARIIVLNIPHHVNQRGNGGARVFFSDDDYTYYLKLLKAACAAAKIRCLGYVLMPNHVYLILVPRDSLSLSKAMSAAHRAYAGHLNARRKKTGHFWQGRFGCVAIGGEHALNALRYVLLNPVRVKLCTMQNQWQWSTAKSCVKAQDNDLTDTKDMLAIRPEMKSLLESSPEKDMAEMLLRSSETIGRPLGSVTFLNKLERKLGCTLKTAKRGPKACQSGIK